MATVSVSGPFFDERNPAAMQQLEDDGLTRLGGQALANVHTLLDTSLRNPTPYYETQLMTERQGDTQFAHDRDIIYGPWLEGVGSRNATTRFKGYHHWRLATQQLEAQADQLLVPLVDQAVGRLNS
ncbi:hypothetical protein DMC63_01285 [Streptomyces sp. WAC 05977]|nr:hypothetical protein DMC63_01285 [Streptomyces sp. WAC 05977]